MKITLNGIEQEIGSGTSLVQLLESAGYGQRRIAVEINREIVPRSRYDSCLLDDGDRIEIVQAIGGG